MDNQEIIRIIDQWRNNTTNMYTAGLPTNEWLDGYLNSKDYKVASKSIEEWFTGYEYRGISASPNGTLKVRMRAPEIQNGKTFTFKLDGKYKTGLITEVDVMDSLYWNVKIKLANGETWSSIQIYGFSDNNKSGFITVRYIAAIGKSILADLVKQVVHDVNNGGIAKQRYAERNRKKCIEEAKKLFKECAHWDVNIEDLTTAMKEQYIQSICKQ